MLAVQFDSVLNLRDVLTSKTSNINLRLWSVTYPTRQIIVFGGQTQCKGTNCVKHDIFRSQSRFEWQYLLHRNFPAIEFRAAQFNPCVQDKYVN